MQQKAIEQAAIRLQRATAALNRLSKAGTAPEMEAGWQDLLAASGAIYSKLEQGSKSNGKSAAWFGKRKNERKIDPLLQYVHQARNSSEHSIGDIADQVHWEISMTGGESGNFIGAKRMPDGTLMPATNADPSKITTKGPHLILRPVTNYGVVYPPPSAHKGQPLEDATPTSVGELLVAHLASMVAEAEGLVAND